MVFMNFWHINHYGAKVEDDVVANLKYQMVIQLIMLINGRIDA